MLFIPVDINFTNDAVELVIVITQNTNLTSPGYRDILYSERKTDGSVNNRKMN